MASGVQIIESHHLASESPTSSSVTVVTGDTSTTSTTNVVIQTEVIASDNVVAVEVLAGIQGPPGVDGIIGVDGKSAYEIAVENGFVGTEEEWLLEIEGEDGREVEVQNSGTFIQWRYVGDPTWTDIISIASITGSSGSDGADGSDGVDGAAGINANEIAPFSVGGTLAVQAYSLRIYATRNVTISSVRASCGTAPTGASLKVDVNKNGTTIFTNQANRPEIAIGANTDTSVPDVTALVDGDYLTFDIDQVGSTVAGSDLVIQVVAN